MNLGLSLSLESGQGQSQGQSQLQVSEGRKGYIGQILEQVYDFLRNGNGSGDYQMISPVNANKSVIAREFFTKSKKNDNIYLVNSEALPFDPDIRAIVCNQGKVLVETSKIDFGRLEDILKNEAPEIELRKKAVYFNGESLVTTRTQNAIHMGKSRDFDIRTLSKLPRYDSSGVNEAIKTMDLVYEFGCFEDLDKIYTKTSDKKEGESTVVAAVPRIDTRLRQTMTLEMRQEMQVLQVPLLALQQTMNAYQIQRRRFSGRILMMGAVELENFVRNALP